MAQTLSSLNNQIPVTSLDTYNRTLTAAGPHVMQVYANDIMPNGLVITLQRNGSTVAATSASQPVMSVSAVVPGVIGDVLSIIISSSLPLADGIPNNFKALINIRTGCV